MNTVRRRPWVALFVTLLLMSAAAFAVGTTVERAHVQEESATEGQHTETTATDGDADSGEVAPEAPAETAGSANGDESLFGVDPESTTTLMGALLASVLLAGASWWRPVRPLLLLGAASALPRQHSTSAYSAIR